MFVKGRNRIFICIMLLLICIILVILLCFLKKQQWKQTNNTVENNATEKSRLKNLRKLYVFREEVRIV